MSKAYLTPNGKVIKSEGLDILSIQNAKYSLSNVKFDMEGKLEMFTLNNALVTDTENTYIYTDNKHYFLDYDRKKGKTGFLKKSYFIKLKNNNIETADFINNKENIDDVWFDGHFQVADEGDIFYIEKVYYNIDEVVNNEYYYFKILKQEFKIRKDSQIDFKNSATYPKEIELNLESGNYNKINIEVRDRLNGSSIEEGNFFKVNFEKISKSSLSADSKNILWGKLTAICFAIYWIKRDVLDIIAMSSIDEILNAVKNGTINIQNNQQEYKYLEIDRLVGNLLEDWGYNGRIKTKELLPVPNNDAYYGGYDETFTNYQEALDNFYHNLRDKNEAGLFPDYPIIIATNPYSPPPVLTGYELLKWRSNERIKVLKTLLPSQAWSLLPYEYREGLIKNYITLNSLKGEDETQCLRIIHSFYLVPSDGNNFLRFLLKKDNEIHTNFERLFILFDDKTISQVSPVVGFFAQEKTNRRNFIYGLYEIWKRSYYDFRYIPEGITPNIDGINPNAFFLSDKAKIYYQPDADKKYFNTLEFGIVELPPKFPGDSPGWGTKEEIDTQYYVDTNLQIEKIHITKTITHSFKSVNQDGLYIGDQVGDPKSWPTQKEHLYLHLYQPINLISYKPDQDLKDFLPQDPLVPAFVYFYCQKYEEIKNINAAWGLAIDITIEAIFFFISGGISAIKDLRYLKYTTEIGKAFRGVTSAEKAVLILREAEIGGEMFTLTAGMCMSAANYMSIKHDDNPALKRMAENVGLVFFFLTMLGAGATLYARRQATKAAYRVINDVDNFATLPQDIKKVITHLTGETEVIIGNFKSVLNQLDNDKKNLYNGFVALQPDLQRAFYAEFSKATQAQLKILNKEENLVTRWSSMYSKGIEDRKIIDVLVKEERVNTIVKYYTEATDTNMRNIIEGWDYDTRWGLLNKTKTDQAVFNAYKADTDLLKAWKDFYKEANTTKKFSNMTAERQAEFLVEHGKNFNKFKDNPKLIDYWDNFSISHIAYRNKIEFLEGVYHFKIKDLNAYDHYAFFKNRPKSGTTGFKCTGGHTENIILDGSNAHWASKYGVKVLDPNYAHTINPTTTSQKMKDYLNGIGNKVYEKINLPDGHFEHKNILFEKNPQPASYNMDQWVLNGKVYDFKRMHTQYKDAWTEEYIIHDMALARMNKIFVSTQSKAASLQFHGQSREWIETTYKSTLLDGSDVTIKHVNHHRYNLQAPFDDHYSYFEID